MEDVFSSQLVVLRIFKSSGSTDLGSKKCLLEEFLLAFGLLINKLNESLFSYWKLFPILAKMPLKRMLACGTLTQLPIYFRDGYRK